MATVTTGGAGRVIVRTWSAGTASSSDTTPSGHSMVMSTCVAEPVPKCASTGSWVR